MSCLEQVRELYDPLPYWLEVLASEADRTTQGKAAKRIGYSAAVVCNVLKGTYKGDLKAVKSAVLDTLMRGTLDCPVLGEISGEDCRVHQQKPFAATSSHRVQVYRACRAGCPHSRIAKGDED